jgi:TonB-dependent receptor
LKHAENKLRFGAAVQNKKKSFDARVFGYRIPNAGTHNYDLEYLSQDAIFAPENMSKQGYSLQEITSKSDSYTASGDTYSGYLMAEQKITKNFRAILGARIESYRQIINSQTFGGDTINVDTTITNILPSINLVYALNEKSNLRLSGSQTVSRPIFRELSPFSFFDFELNAAIQGNDTLTTTKITNVDARYEWFPGLNQLLAVTLFYKDFQKPIEQITDKGSTTTLYTFINTPRATAYGAELEFRAKWTALRYLVEWKQWENFSIYGNFAYVQSRVDQSNIPGIGEKYRQMQGQSPYIINTGINYTNAEKGTSVTLSFNRIGRRLWSVGTTGAVGNRYLEIWEAPRSVLDIQLSQKVFKNGEIKLNIADLLNQRLNFYQDVDGNGKFTKNSTDKLIIGTTFGWNSSLGFSYKF